METAQIEMSRQEAIDKYNACIMENHADAFEFNQACQVAYEALADGYKLISLSKSIRLAGLDEKGMPKLAVSRADRKQVYFDWPARNEVALYCTEARPDSSWTRRGWPELNCHVKMGQHHNDESYGGRTGYALVPAVPADVRPETGQLKDWFILWEVDGWSDKSFRVEPPYDPILLKHIGGDLYAVLAEWDLTGIERAIMGELIQQ